MTSFQLYSRGKELLKASKFFEAEKLLKESIIKKPHHKTCELLGEVCIKTQKYTEAIVYLAAATTLNKGSRAPSLLAEAFYACNQKHESFTAAYIALSRDPRNRRALEIVARIDSEKSKYIDPDSLNSAN